MNVRIYKLLDPNNNSVMYVGKTIQTLKQRLRGHIHCGKHKSSKRDLWVNSLLLNKQLPIILLIEDVSENLWQEREIYWINYYKEINKDLTNSTIGGGGTYGFTRKEESNIKLSELKSKPIYQLDKKLNIIKEFKSCKEAQEITKIISISVAATNNLHRTAGGYIWVYKKDYDDFIKNPKKRNFIAIKPTLYKKIKQYDKNMNFIKEWESPTTAGRELNLSYRNICQAAGGYKKTYAGYIWKYQNEI